MKTYLVTGGAGFIGSNFVIYMLKEHKDIRIINLDALTYAGNLENLKSVEKNDMYTFVKGNIRDRELVQKLFSENEIHYVVNFAAESHVDRSITNPEIFIESNVLGTMNLLNCAMEAWKVEDGYKEGVKFLQVSTDEVYGSLGETGYFTETNNISPNSPYSASKASADLLVNAYHETYKLPVNITRCSNNYGPYQFPEKLIPLIINNCMSHRGVPVYGDGLNVRDWLYVEDHCKAIDLVVSKGKVGEVYNIGGHNEKTNIDIVKLVIKYLGRNVDENITEDLIAFVKDRKGHDRRYAIDSSKIKEDLGWYPETCFEEGIVKTIEWYLANYDWLKNVVSKDYVEYYRRMYERSEK
ncbi:dTDP-glucose 4,6-dehydratase [Hathewaya proteolytica DSM 3090]|uniref:dTDP-glucose 4,6-dehydratase n=1 Tax=Hathewaya proteolytica DSM 3090 TaxID=1121331 RepID=A0A1M6PSH6_9CLOT|nr:dTDP-glucose 4,6-dehydratase [Hathewaya proteolytica]SHK10842.1 dTDP-glucose 4,6-dehydratase [Hathewaya proteolytica DSM 3090]